MHDASNLRTMLHVEPVHAVALLLQDLASAQTKGDLRDWLVETNLLSSGFFEEWWTDMLVAARSSSWINWEHDTISLTNTPGTHPVSEGIFPDKLTPGARLNLALANRDSLDRAEYLEQVCRAWVGGSSQVKNLALQATIECNPSAIIAQLIELDDGGFASLIHCVRQSSWVPAQVDDEVLDKLMRLATQRLTPESPLNSEARLAAALLRWGHPTIEANLTRSIQSSGGQRLLYSLFSTLPHQRSLDLIRTFFGRCMRAERLAEARWCAREWSLRATMPIANLAREETDPELAAWLHEVDVETTASASASPCRKSHGPTNRPIVLSELATIRDEDVLDLALAIARSLAAHHEREEAPIIEAGQMIYERSGEVSFNALLDTAIQDYNPYDDIYRAATVLLEVLLGRELPAHLPPRVFLPYLRQLRPMLAARLLGPLSQALAQDPALRPEDGSDWLALLESAEQHEKTAVNTQLKPELSYDSHIGHKKLQHSQVNQDSLFAQTNGNFALAVICDGVSRCEIGSGDKASRIATRTVSELWTHAPDSLANSPWAEVVSFLQRAIATANIAVTNATIREASSTSAHKAPMASTLVAAICRGNQVSVSWLGDSRAYIVGPNGACLVTADHQSAANQIANWQSGADNELEALSTCLSRYLGANLELTSPMTLDVQSLQFCLASDERLVLCSDGVSGYLADEDAAAEGILADVCTRSRLSLSASELIYLANLAGGWDNASCIVLRATQTRSEPVDRPGS
jgi:serine/threonine protein phosphatase PrpC